MLYWLDNCLPAGTIQTAGWHFQLHGWLCRIKRMHARQLELTRTDQPVTVTTLPAAGIDLTALATEITSLAMRMSDSNREALPAINLHFFFQATGTDPPATQGQLCRLYNSPSSYRENSAAYKDTRTSVRERNASIVLAIQMTLPVMIVDSFPSYNNDLATTETALPATRQSC
jgi:hypothetical protein